MIDYRFKKKIIYGGYNNEQIVLIVTANDNRRNW